MAVNDAAQLEILRNYFNSAVTNMGNVIERTAFSTYVRESADFATALASPTGEFYSYPTTVGVTIFLGLSLERAIKEVGKIEEGDIIITNDPYRSNGLATHLVDINVFKPIFYHHQLVSYSWTFVNVSDVGGSVPSSLSPNLTSIFQEGFRIPPMKLYHKGVPDQNVLKLLAANTRTPRLNLGDIDAMVSAVNTGEKLLLNIIDKFGEVSVLQGMNDLMNQAENRSKSVISEINDGVYEFSDYIGDDFESNVPVRLAVTTTIHEGKIDLDFSNCDPQVKTAFNIMTNGEKNSFLLQGLINFIISKDPYIPINGGIMRPITVNMPKGTLVNPNFPAPVGIRHTIAMRMYNVILGSLLEAGVKAIPAAGAGQAAIVVLHNNSTSSTRKNKMAVVEPIGGGGGATSISDGIDGIDHASGFLKNTPIEVLEQNMDILVHEYEYIENTAGVGQYRGGNAISLKFEIVQPAAVITARGIDRMKFQPWGVFGGHAGQIGKLFLNENGQNKRIEKISVLPVKQGNIISVVSPSGGGYGNPYRRAINEVLADVANDLLTVNNAREWYGVVIEKQASGYEIDVDETKKIRNKIILDDSDIIWEFGQYRDQYEKRWTSSISSYTAVALRTRVPVELISDIKHEMHNFFQNQKNPLSIDSIDKYLANKGF
ncbi:hydantoinase B/oxoprolinase family protein [Loigolactobacillus binensis]|uniref:Hydantoinase B/oxoprolinase family protein n=1 Tax=Loigolactobacillus binensis TaxID=2559922 RepID=A0ABW3EDZ6_9LACO|nr:hydantoinase B/oxoprolinase family protein [Loigolactobacillus binensis]